MTALKMNLFSSVIIEGNLESLQHIYNSVRHLKSASNIKSTNNAFVKTCRCGHMETAQWFLSVYPNKLNSKRMLTEAFKEACFNGHLNLAKWLDGLLQDNEPMKCNVIRRAFTQSCIKQQWDVLNWILSIEKYKCTIIQDVILILISMCFHGECNMVEWIFLNVYNEKLSKSSYEIILISTLSYRKNYKNNEVKNVAKCLQIVLEHSDFTK